METSEAASEIKPNNLSYSKISQFLNDGVVTRTNSQNRKNLGSSDFIMHHIENIQQKVLSPKAAKEPPTEALNQTITLKN